MGDTMRRMPIFSFHDRTGIVNYLEEKALKGWMLEKTSALGWKFRRIEPKKIHFAVTYFPEASSFDPGPSEKQLRFQDFCEYTGWKLITSSAQMQIFYNEEKDPTPIETDPEIELNNIHASAKKMILPNYLLQIFVGLIQVVLVLSRLFWDPIGVLSENVNFFNLFCWGMICLMSLVELVSYYRWRRAAKRAIEMDGSFVDTKSRPNFQLIILFFVFAALGFMLASYGGILAVSVILHIGALFGVIGIVMAISNYMKTKRVSAKANRNVTMILLVIFTLAVMFLMVLGIISSMDSISSEREPVRTIDVKTEFGRTVRFKIYHDDIPLKIEDLMVTDYQDYTYEEGRVSESLVMRRYEAGQNAPYNEEDVQEMDYNIVTVKLPIIYEYTKKAMLKEFAGTIYAEEEGVEYLDMAVPVDEAPWGAREAYQLKEGGELYEEYFLCYEDRFVEIRFNWNVTEEQKALIGQKLGNEGK